jgi:AcrR family transcriptional regulator
MTKQDRKVTSKGLKARSALLEAALESFSRSGYGAASVADIVAAAGLTKNHLFYHFGSKEALAAAALEQALSIWRAELALPAGIFPEAPRQLGFIIRKLAEGRQLQSLRLLGVLRLDPASLPAELATQLNAADTELSDFWRRLLKGLKSQGGIAASEKARALSGSIICLLYGAAIADDGNNGMFASQVAFLGRLLKNE